jgi:hypothetical protein
VWKIDGRRHKGVGLEPDEIDARPRPGQRLEEEEAVRPRQNDAHKPFRSVRERSEPAHGLRRKHLRSLDHQEERLTSRQPPPGEPQQLLHRRVASRLAEGVEDRPRKRIRPQRSRSEDQ